MGRELVAKHNCIKLTFNLTFHRSRFHLNLFAIPIITLFLIVIKFSWIYIWIICRIWQNLFHKTTSGGSKGALGTRTPISVQFFFHFLGGINGQPRFSPPPLGLAPPGCPGSATNDFINFESCNTYVIQDKTRFFLGKGLFKCYECLSTNKV